MMCVAVGMAVVGQARLVITRLARAMVKARVMGGQILCAGWYVFRARIIKNDSSHGAGFWIQCTMAPPLRG